MNLQLDQLKEPVLKGHPLHALLTDLPVGMLTLGVACDVLGLATRQPGWRIAARAAHTGALVSGAAAALVGLWDYQAVPPEHPARKVGALHGYLNAGAMSLVLGSVLLRRDAQAPLSGRPNLAASGLALAAFAGLGVSGWLGGKLVFELGWRVEPAEHAEQLEASLRARGDTSLIDQAHHAVEQHEQEHALLP